MGHVAGSYGLRGWVKVAPGGGASQGLADAKEWWIGDKAYKVVAKLAPGTVFAHREFVVDRSLRAVRHQDLSLTLHVELDDDRVHACAFTGRSVPAFAVTRADGDFSVAARALLVQCFSLRSSTRPAR